jgi:hypothetical protein
VIRKVLWFSVPAALGALVAFQWQDVLRYAKIKQMSLGKGHPEIVPAGGARAYARDSAHGDPDGTGDFDSARRGGPANARPGPVKPGEARRG